MNLQINAKLVSNWTIIVYILLTNLFASYGQKSLALLQVFYKLQSCKIAQKQRKTPGSYIVSKTEKWTPSNSSPFLSASKSFTKLTKQKSCHRSFQEHIHFHSFQSNLIWSMEPLLSILNKVYSTKFSSAMFWGATWRTLVHTCPAHLRQRWERRRRPLGCEWLQVNSTKLPGTIGYPLGVEGGEAAPPGPRARMGEKLRQPRPAEKQESGSTTEAPPLSVPAHAPWSGQRSQGRADLCSVPRVA